MSLFGIRNRHARPLKIIFAVLAVIIAVASYYGYKLYSRALADNVALESGKKSIIYIYPNSTYEDLLDSLDANSILVNTESFKWMAGFKDLPSKIKPGRYVLRAGMNNRKIVNMFIAGLEEPFMVFINKKRKVQPFADYIASKFMFDTGELLTILNNRDFLGELGYTPDNVLGMMISDSYEFRWTDTPEMFVRRMKTEYDKYWDEERKQKAFKLGLEPQDVIILASIVEEETAKEDEKPAVAELYLNRLEKNMLLQADPTVKYAVNDFTITRVLYRHLEVESPYNTYKYKGLPPGPICIPFKTTLEAVLNPDEHDYLFMCAKHDFSGYHNFAKTNRQHEINRQKYIKAYKERYN